MTWEAAGPHSGLGAHVIVIDVCYERWKNYSYLIADSSGHAVVVDPAWEMEKIERVLAGTRARLSGILLTHAHDDHTHLARPLAEKHDCPIWMSTVEIARSRFRADQLVGIDARSWTVGGVVIYPILTPGHTPGSTCYLIEENLFTGDVLFAEGCGLCRDHEAAYEMFASLQTLKATLAPHTRIFPGHSYGQPPGRMLSDLQRDNMYLQFTDARSFASFRLRRGQNMTRMFDFA